MDDKRCNSRKVITCGKIVEALIDKLLRYLTLNIKEMMDWDAIIRMLF